MLFLYITPYNYKYHMILFLDDFNRVKLFVDDHEFTSDYINANFVDVSKNITLTYYNTFASRDTKRKRHL